MRYVYVTRGTNNRNAESNSTDLKYMEQNVQEYVKKP